MYGLIGWVDIARDRERVKGQKKLKLLNELIKKLNRAMNLFYNNKT